VSFCAFIGDSIAVGLALVAAQCDKAAVVGLSTPAIIRHVHPAHHYRIAYVSAGSNDMPNELLRRDLGRNLFALRGRINAAEVVWIVPVHPYAATRVLEVARYFGDRAVDFAPGPDHLHPKSYPALWRSIRDRVEND
jgi:hypothetical protein